ncbi:ABC-2 type transporter [candidate division TM7 genomosp. GTL1]|nr:ABC-2 type transporter [candidate division TM7 genomosp. GTL1]
MNTITHLKRKYRYSTILLREMVITDFKLRYKGSILGYVWTLLRPLALFATLYVVFVYFLRFGSDTPYFPVYLLLGIVLWNYFVEVTANGVSAIVGKGDLLRKLSFPRYVVVVAGSFSALINLTINFIVVGIFMVFGGVPFTLELLWLIPIVLELFVLSLALAFILSALYVRLRDINYVWEVILQAGFYATPILYPFTMVMQISPEAAKFMILSPMAQIIQDARAVAITDQTVTIGKLFGTAFARLIPLAIVVVIAVVAVIYFRRRSPHFAEEI